MVVLTEVLVLSQGTDEVFSGVRIRIAWLVKCTDYYLYVLTYKSSKIRAFMGLILVNQARSCISDGHV